MTTETIVDCEEAFYVCFIHPLHGDMNNTCIEAVDEVGGKAVDLGFPVELAGYLVG